MDTFSLRIRCARGRMHRFRKKFPNTRAITVARFVSLFLSRLASKVETFLLAEDTSFPPVANFEIACYNGQTEANNLLSETISRKWRLRATVTIPKYGKYRAFERWSTREFFTARITWVWVIGLSVPNWRISLLRGDSLLTVLFEPFIWRERILDFSSIEG